jgi:tripartite ATP-independent transporter DctM subunit
MEWWLVLIWVFGGMVVLLLIGLPVAFAFLLVNIVGAFFILGGVAGISQMVLQIFSSLTTFLLLPVPMFIFMGEIMFHSGVAVLSIETVEKWMGRIPGRLSLLSVAGGSLFSTLSGSSMANTALLGTVMMPEMTKRGYKSPMSVGPIIGAGGLAMLIPPSALAVILASLAFLDIGKILIGGVIPGVMIAILYAAYIIIRCKLQPDLTPAYEVAVPPLSERIMSFVKFVLPLGSIIFLVIGVILLGIATPTEAAATGALGSILLAAAYRKLNLDILKKSIEGTLRITVMVFMIILASKTFSQVLSFSGATQSLVRMVLDLPVPPIAILISMQLILIFLGVFVDQVSMMMISLPLFMPLVVALHFDPIWFGILMLLNMEMALTTPPFGLNLFVMKGIAPPGVTMKDIITAGLPFLLCDLLAMIIIIAYPPVALWLPGL